MEFKDRIKELRLEKNLSHTQLASLFSKSEAAARAWETGRTKPDADTLITLAQHFDCSVDYLLGLSEHKNDDSKKAYEATYGKLESLLSSLDANDKSMILDFYTKYLETFNLSQSREECYRYALELTSRLRTFLPISLHYRFMLYHDLFVSEGNPLEAENTKQLMAGFTALSASARTLTRIIDKNVDDVDGWLKDKGVTDFYFNLQKNADDLYGHLKQKDGDDDAAQE